MSDGFYFLLWVHIAAGALALASGLLTLFLTVKGSRRHIRTGLFFWYAMSAMAATGIVLAIWRPDVVFVFIGALSLYLINTGRDALTRQGGKVNSQTWFWFGTVIACFIAGIALGSWSISRGEDVFGSNFILYFAMAFDSLIFIVLDWRLIRSGGATGKRRIVDHLWRMIGALFFATFALLVANPQLYPDWFTDTGLSLLPGLVLLIVLAYWVIAVRSGRWLRKPETTGRAWCSAALAASVILAAADASAEQWAHYGADLNGSRFAHSEIITPETVTELAPAWTYRSGDATTGDGRFSGRASSFKATPILIGDALIFSTGFNRIHAVDARTGSVLWRYDPEVDFSIGYSEMFTSRGVAAWVDPEAKTGADCAVRVFLGTLDARLVAVDAANGEPCAGFGRDGVVDLSKGVANFRRGEYSMTSPPTVVNGVVVTGSSVGDNGGVALDSGVVRGWDARSGELLWRFDPIPRKKSDAGWETWEKGAARRTGAANVWSIISADAERGLVYLPTTSPSPDFYGGERLGDNRHANSIVALEVATGEVVWAYQVVRHDLWDYDLASQPLLIDLTVGGKTRPALAQATKMGFVFVLDRQTGEPLLPVSERRVPASDVPGERAAATQRFPSIALHPISAEMPSLWALSAEHVEACQRMVAGARYEGPFTPPSLGGTLLFPGNPGGVNWGSMAAHPERGIALVAVNRLPTLVKLIPRTQFAGQARARQLNGVEAQFTSQSGTPYGMARFEVYNRDNFLPCYEGPWATLAALDLDTGKTLWEVPAGVAPGLQDHPDAKDWGFFVAGGPLVTAGGVAFLATPFDRRMRAYGLDDGQVLWETALPAQPHATPMSYELDGVQYVVIAAGGDLAEAEGQGDYLLAWRVAPPPLRHAPDMSRPASEG